MAAWTADDRFSQYKLWLFAGQISFRPIIVLLPTKVHRGFTLWTLLPTTREINILWIVFVCVILKILREQIK